MGLGYALLAPEKFEAVRNALAIGPRFLPGWWVQGSLVGLITFAGICWLLHRAARSAPDQLGSG